MADKTRTAERWGDLFALERPLYEAFAARLRDLIFTLLEADEIDAVQVSWRAKTVTSFVDKVRLKEGRYDDPVRDMTDLAGVRVVLYYSRDVARVGAILAREFAIDETNSLRADERLPLDRFGYVSDHYILSLNEARGKLTEWTPYSGFTAEVQVRTAVQDAWAAINHKISYKNSVDMPREVKRRLFRISALLEVADDEFEAVRVAGVALADQYERQVQSGDLSLALDASAVDAYVANAPRAREWVAKAREVGFDPLSPDDLRDEDDEPARPENLVRAARHAGFETVADLDAFLGSVGSWGSAALKTALGDGMLATDDFVLAVLVMVGAPLDLASLQREAEYGDRFYNSLIAARKALES